MSSSLSLPLSRSNSTTTLSVYGRRRQMAATERRAICYFVGPFSAPSGSAKGLNEGKKGGEKGGVLFRLFVRFFVSLFRLFVCGFSSERGPKRNKSNRTEPNRTGLNQTSASGKFIAKLSALRSTDSSLPPSLYLSIHCPVRPSVRLFGL